MGFDPHCQVKIWFLPSPVNFEYGGQHTITEPLVGIDVGGKGTGMTPEVDKWVATPCNRICY